MGLSVGLWTAIAAYLVVLGTLPWWATLLYRALFGYARSPHGRIWMARRSGGFVGVRSRRELVHLPAPLEALVVEAQRIRLRLLPLDPLRESSLRALWEWLAALRDLERRDAAALERFGVRHGAIAGRLGSVWETPQNRDARFRGVTVPQWLLQLLILDQELWAFIRATRAPRANAYR